MRAVAYEQFGGPVSVGVLPEPDCPPGGVLVRVEATGLCRSDWHGWRGHDDDITAFPHVPGHEFSGTVVEVGAGVTGWVTGDRVTAPFVCACGTCATCRAGDQQICEAQEQPGFTHWGSFAEIVAVRHAAVNLVRLPEPLSFAGAAALGCRFATAFRAIVDQGRVRPGDWVAIHGCGGVGRAAGKVAVACGAHVVAVDVSEAALSLAAALGAAVTIDASTPDTDTGALVRELTDGGARLSVDALGSATTCAASIGSLRRRGRHVQVGLLPAALGPTALPMDRVVAHELELVGSHGLPAHAYPRLLGMLAAGALDPERLVTRTLTLEQLPGALVTMDQPGPPGIRLCQP